MATIIINNEQQLVSALNTLSRDLLVYLSKKVMKLMKKYLGQGTNISTTSMEEGVDYSINAQGTEATIYIDYEFVEDTFAEPPVFEGGKMVEWGQFTNTFGKDRGSRMWKGQPISFRMAEWLEYGGDRHIGNLPIKDNQREPKYIGNQPIKKNQWFTKTESDVKANLNKWVQEFLSKRLK